jgi:hypothetical protein
MQVIADEMEKRFTANKRAAGKDGVPVTAWFGLHDETNARTEITTRFGVGTFVTWTDHHAELLDPGTGCLLQHNLQRRFRLAVLIDQSLERERALTRIGSSDEGFTNFHGLNSGPMKSALLGIRFNRKGASQARPELRPPDFRRLRVPLATESTEDAKGRASFLRILCFCGHCFRRTEFQVGIVCRESNGGVSVQPTCYGRSN